jgi:hypothetical protein
LLSNTTELIIAVKRFMYRPLEFLTTATKSFKVEAPVLWETLEKNLLRPKRLSDQEHKSNF